jgi:hypothetical protein
MPLHRNANTPPPKPGYFMVFIYPQVVHSVVFTTIFFVSVVSICTTVTEKNQSHSTHHTEHTSHHHHGRRRPRPLPPSVAVHCRFWHKARPRHIVAGFRHARFCIFPRGLVSSDAFFHQCSLMRQREALRRGTARRLQRGGSSTEAAAVAAGHSATASARWQQHGGCGDGGGAQRDGFSAVAAARRLRRWRLRNSATASARWQQHGGCSGGGCATARRHNLRSGK